MSTYFNTKSKYGNKAFKSIPFISSFSISFVVFVIVKLAPNTDTVILSVVLITISLSNISNVKLFEEVFIFVNKLFKSKSNDISTRYVFIISINSFNVVFSVILL